MSMTALAPTAPTSNNGARLVSADGRELPLRHVALDADAGSGLATTIIRQSFHNPFDAPLRVTYQLPLPADGAVIDFSFTLGDRRITGRVERKADARVSFEQALIEGRTAALLEQDRSSLFTQELGNVPAGAEVTAEIVVEHRLAWQNDGWEWRFPTVVAPRFLGEANQTPDAGRVTVDVLDGPKPTTCAMSIRIADPCTGPAVSPSHVVETEGDAWKLAADARLDRDVVVRWPVAAVVPGVTVDVTWPTDHEDAYALLTVVPPTSNVPTAPVARDLILLLDISGSMGGRPMEQLKAFSRSLIRSMGPDDQLEMIAFASQPLHWRKAATPMTPANQHAALTWLEALRAGGCTLMHDAIKAALNPLRTDAQRQVVLISDGLIGFEHEVIGAVLNDLPPSSRVHTVGVGSGVNRSLTGPVARAGAGVEVVVGLDEPVQPAVTRLLARTDQPLVVDLSIDGVRRVAPACLPDLYAGAPALLAVALSAEGGAVTIRGRTAEGLWSQTVTIPSLTEGAGRRSVATCFARECIEDLELRTAAGQSVDGQIESLGLKHQIATRLTSWIAETDQPEVDPEAATKQVTVPHALPHGMSAEGVGLRQASMPLADRAVALMAIPPPRTARRIPPSGMAPPARPASEGAPKRKKAKKSSSVFGRVLDALGIGGSGIEEDWELDEAEMEGEPAIAPPSDAPARLVEPEPAPVRRLVAAIRLHRDGKLVLEIRVDGADQWQPGSDVDALIPDGTRTRAEVLKGTTAAGPVVAGDVIRLVIAWDDGELPDTISVGGWMLEVR